MATNERMLQFGLGEADHVTDLTVDWPSAGKTTMHNLPVNATIELVERSRRGFVQRDKESSSHSATVEN